MLKHRIKRLYYINKKIFSERHYLKKGHVLLKNFHVNGIQIRSQYFKNRKIHGLCTYWSKNGTISCIQQHKTNNLQGMLILFNYEKETNVLA